MPNAVVGALRVILSADTAEFKSGLDEAAKLTKSFSTVAAAAIAATATAVGAITVSVIKLGEHGADVADISNQFKVLNNEIGNSADAIRSKLRTAFAGTVSDFELMKATNIALSQGLQLNADQFEVVGQSARVLADRVGGDAKDAFEKLTMAMATGQDRQLKTIGLNIDAEAAVRKYAEAIGKERSELTESETITAKKNAILAELNRTLKVSGKAQFDFADAVKASRVMIDNFRDSLGQAIAQSPVVNEMLATFQRGIEAGFGPNQQAMVEKLTSLVNKFAIFLVDVARVAVTAAGVIYRAFSGLEIVFNFVMDGITGIIATLLESTATALELATKIPLVGDAYKQAAFEARDFANTAHGVSEGFAEQTRRAIEGAKGTDAFGQAIGKTQEFLSTMRGAMVEASHAQVENTEATDDGTRASGQHAEALGKQGRAAVTTSAQIDRLTASFIRQIKAWEESRHQLSLPVLPEGFSLPRAIFNLPNSMDLLKMFEPLKQAFTDNLSPSFWQKAWAPMKAGLSQTLSDIPQTIANAFTGGGDIMGAIKSVVSQIGSAVGSSIGFAFGGPLGQKIGAAIGSMAGMLVEPFKRLFGIGLNSEVAKFNKEIDKVRENLLKQFGSMERIRKLGIAVGIDLAGSWRHQGEAGLKAFQELAAEFEKRVQQMEDDLEGFQGDLADAFDEARNLGYVFDQTGKFVSVSFEKMQDVANEFGVNLQALGPAFQGQRLAADAKKIIDAFTLLAKGGADAGTILFGLQDEISKLVQDSFKFGTTIPKNMEPWIAELIRAGLLVDEDGRKITDIGKIKFGEPVKTQFEEITDKIGDLIDKIGDLIDLLTGGLTPALDEATKDRTGRIHWDIDPIPSQALEFDTGTIGKFGKWFGNFGSGMAATLHGMEAVVTPKQAPAFAMDVLSGLSASSTQTAAPAAPVVQSHIVNENHIIIDGLQMKTWIQRTIAESIETNHGGLRSRLRDGLGVTT